MKLKIKDVENAFGIEIRQSTISLGLDTATKTGYCIATTTKKTIDLSVGFINVDVKEIKDKDLRNELRYEEIYRKFKSLIQPKYIVVIENVYHSFNAQTTILLSRIGAIAWTLARTVKAKTIWKTASQARKALGINQKCPRGKSKEVITDRVNTLLNISITNNDEIDAIVLAITGLIKMEDNDVSYRKTKMRPHRRNNKTKKRRR